jgi:hypothetical protein
MCTIIGMELGSMTSIERELRGQCEALDPDSVAVADVLALFRCLERLAKLVAGAELRLARRVDEAGVGRVEGCRDTAEFLARETGTSVGAARNVLDTSRRLTEQRATDAALSAGQLSGEQARLVSDAAAAQPAAEHRLLAAARGRTTRDLKQRCLQVKANAHPDSHARHEAIHRSRACRTWTDAEGAWNLHVRHLPEVGAEVEALLAPFTHGRFEAGRRSGSWEPREAYRADALLDLARAAKAGPGPKGARRADTKVFVHIDLETLQGAQLRPDSRCHVEGIGAVDPDHVRSILGEAFLVALVHDGREVRSVVHLGRQVTAHQRSALEARGYRCEVPGCEVTWGLEIDHTTQWSLTRTTTLDELAWACRHHHHERTHLGARLSGPVGNRRWTPPPPGGRRRTPPSTAEAPPGTADPDPALTSRAACRTVAIPTSV